MLSKMLLKIVCFLGHRFGKILGRVLGGFWETKNLDFRISFDNLSKQKSKCVLDSKRLRKNAKNKLIGRFLGRPGGMRGLPGREKEGGQKP